MNIEEQTRIDVLTWLNNRPILLLQRGAACWLYLLTDGEVVVVQLLSQSGM